jgi:P27 family predicted phage terminase small subunit
LKKLRGNPGKRELPKNEPAPAVDPTLGEPSAWLDDEAKAEWRRLAAEMLRIGTLTTVDRAAFEGYCKAYSRWLAAEKFLDKNGLTVKVGRGFLQPRPQVGYLQKMREFASEFGLTPASRSRLHVEAGEGDKDPYQEYLDQRRSGAPAESAGGPGTARA